MKPALLLTVSAALLAAGLLLALTASPHDGALSARAIAACVLVGAGTVIPLAVAVARRGNRRHRM